MNWVDVLNRVQRGEDELTELKESLQNDAIAKALCAFANSAGGLLVIGVDDAGNVVGIPDDPESAHERLTSLLQSALTAPVQARIGRHDIQDDHRRAVFWLEVSRYRGPEPLRWSRRVLVRRGRASVDASPQEVQELYNVFGFVLTEEQVVPGTGIGDVEAPVFESFLQRQGIDLISEPQPDLERDLRTRGVVDDLDGQPALTLYGLLCFGRSPQTPRPTQSAWIELVAYRGVDRASDVVVRAEARGRVDQQVERALEWLSLLGTHEEYVGTQRRDVPVVPSRALREAVVNAVAHRDYAILGSRSLVEVFADRIDITSPGELPNHMTEAAALAGAHPRSRNELIAHFLFVNKYMEGRGRGFPIIRREMAAFNGTVPELKNSREGRYVRVTLRRSTTAT